MHSDTVVGVVDYQASNVRSIVNAVEHLGARTVVVAASDDLGTITHLVLPGVGAFGHCAQRLGASGLVPVLTDWALVQQRPLLGICVGMQLMADFSEEHGRHAGLGWAGGAVQPLHGTPPAVRVPHVGWNNVRFDQALGAFAPGDEADFYFDHSFALGAPTQAAMVAHCDHGRRFTAVLRRGNLLAAQFHPEKSQASGLRFLEAFLALPAHPC